MKNRLWSHLTPESKVSYVSRRRQQQPAPWNIFFLFEVLLYGPAYGSGDNRVCSLHPHSAAPFLAPPWITNAHFPSFLGFPWLLDNTQTHVLRKAHQPLYSSTLSTYRLSGHFRYDFSVLCSLSSGLSTLLPSLRPQLRCQSLCLNVCFRHRLI